MFNLNIEDENFRQTGMEFVKEMLNEFERITNDN
jgi:oligoendopeptidase F